MVNTKNSKPSFQSAAACRQRFMPRASGAWLALALSALVAGCSVIPGVSLNVGVMLVSAAEVETYKSDALENITIPLAGDEPAIEIVRPVVKEGKVASPVAIEVRFKPVAGKSIDPASFKLYYGAFKIDVTDRLLKTAKVTSSGFSIDKVDIPAGSHRLVMRVGDDTGAVGIREIKFTVDGA
jgi:hypothetical protein